MRRPEPRRKTKKDRSCETGKVRYFTEMDAKMALFRSQHFDNGHNPIRVYGCPLCNGYHLTSKPYRPGRRGES